MFEPLFQEIINFDTIIIHRHINPDGDAIGSQVGLKHILKDAFPGKRIFAVGDPAGRYAFIEDSITDEISDDIFKNALCIILDCGGEVSDKRYNLAACTARIDHHVFTGAITDIEIIDSSFESCCGLIVSFAQEQRLYISPAAAKALFTGMVTDSGRFRYDSTTPRTFRQAAFLLEQGVDLNEIYRNLYADDFVYKLLRAQYTLKIRFTKNNAAYIYTTKEELAKSGSDVFAISRGMVNVMADIRSVEIWANFTETDKCVLCELRSSVKSIVGIAVKYGGGGHDKACGAAVPDRATAMLLLADLDNMLAGQE